MGDTCLRLMKYYLLLYLDDAEVFSAETSSVDVSVRTSVVMRQIKVRVGYTSFSTNVKIIIINTVAFPNVRF